MTIITIICCESVPPTLALPHQWGGNLGGKDEIHFSKLHDRMVLLIE